MSARDDVASEPVTGSCLCGAVRYRISGPLRDVIYCHCAECRRAHGHFGAYTAAERDDLALLGDSTLRWFTSPESDASARRGFCAQCGTLLFWDAPGRASLSIAAGTLDPPTGLHAQAHIYTAGAADYYPLPDDGLPRHAGP